MIYNAYKSHIHCYDFDTSLVTWAKLQCGNNPQDFRDSPQLRFISHAIHPLQVTKTLVNDIVILRHELKEWPLLEGKNPTMKTYNGS